MRRVLVIGSPGSGKSTFCRALREKTGLPLFYLDMLWHRADHTTVPFEEFDEKLNEILEKEPEWIIDGNYARTLPLRLLYADTVFWFDLPADICLEGIHARLGKRREDMPWEPEDTIDPEFEQYTRDFPKVKRPLLEHLMEWAAMAGIAVHTFHSREDAYAFLEALDTETCAAPASRGADDAG